MNSSLINYILTTRQVTELPQKLSNSRHSSPLLNFLSWTQISLFRSCDIFSLGQMILSKMLQCSWVGNPCTSRRYWPTQQSLGEPLAALLMALSLCWALHSPCLQDELGQSLQKEPAGCSHMAEMTIPPWYPCFYLKVKKEVLIGTPFLLDNSSDELFSCKKIQ